MKSPRRNPTAPPKRLSESSILMVFSPWENFLSHQEGGGLLVESRGWLSDSFFWGIRCHKQITRLDTCWCCSTPLNHQAGLAKKLKLLDNLSSHLWNGHKNMTRFIIKSWFIACLTSFLLNNSTAWLFLKKNWAHLPSDLPYRTIFFFKARAFVLFWQEEQIVTESERWAIGSLNNTSAKNVASGVKNEIYNPPRRKYCSLT